MLPERTNFNNFCLHLTIRPSIQNFENIPKLENKIKNLIQILEKIFLIEEKDNQFTNVYFIDLLSYFLIYLQTIQHPLLNGQNRKAIFDTFANMANMQDCRAKEQIRFYVKQHMSSRDLVFVTSFVVYQLNNFKEFCMDKDDSFWSLWRSRRILLIYDENLDRFIDADETKISFLLEKISSLLYQLYFVPKIRQYIKEYACDFLSKFVSLDVYQSNVLQRIHKLFTITSELAHLSLINRSLWDLFNRNNGKIYVDFENCGDDSAGLENLLMRTVGSMDCIFLDIFRTNYYFNKTSELANKMCLEIKNIEHRTQRENLKNLAILLERCIDIIIDIYLKKEQKRYFLYY